MEFFVLIFLFFLVCVAVLLGFVCAKLAEKNGRNAHIAFVVGLFFGLIGILCYLIAGETEDRKVERMRRVMRTDK